MSKGNILIVDDEIEVRNDLKRYLELFEYKCETAENSLRAENILKEKVFDLILSDVNMPQGDGQKMLETVSKLDNPRPKIILMSGFSELRPDQAKELGAYEYITKPLDLDSLLDLINSALLKS